MTRVALPIWDGRVSPVFDVAEHLLLVELDGTQEGSRHLHALPQKESLARARTLSVEAVDVLICGAISSAMERAVASAGIEVLSGICGAVDDVLRAYARGHLGVDATLHLPGVPLHGRSG